MSIIRVEFAPGFHLGDDAVLLAMDGVGVTTFAAVLKNARLRGSARLQIAGVTHQFTVRDGASEVHLADLQIGWNLDPTTATEIIAACDQLDTVIRPCHYYVDIARPADTLVVSCDEYVP